MHHAFLNPLTLDSTRVMLFLLVCLLRAFHESETVLLCACLFKFRWALYDIARHPEVQKRIVQELADAGLLQVSCVLV